MKYSDNKAILEKINSMFEDCLLHKEYGEFSVSLTMNRGVAVKLSKTDRENLSRHENAKLAVVEK